MDCRHFTAALVAWIKEQVHGAGAQGVTFGLSGGVDSAVVAGLARQAFPDTALGVIMPCHSDPRDVRDAHAVAKAFGLPTCTVVLDRLYDMFLGNLDEGAGFVPSGSTRARRDLAAVNLKPRLRMVALYYIANRKNYLVLGPSNRSELAVGYFTKYGDGGADLLPLAGLVKRDVWRLASFLGVPAEVIDRPPSAGLWMGQTDEQEMGLTYQELDHFLLTGEEGENAAQLQNMMAASQHKRVMPPAPPLTSEDLDPPTEKCGEGVD
jgi:NAD+ synthase